jgi:drug/metabolite transporter (DMT)-like permease
VVLILIASTTRGKRGLLPKWEHKGRFLLLGISMTCNVLGLIFALNWTSSAVVAIFQAMRPIFAGVLSRMLGIEEFTTLKLFGMAVCFAGALVISISDSESETAPSHGWPFVGFCFVCIHSFGQSSYVILQPFLLDAGYSPAVINANAYVVSTVLMALMLPLPIHSGAWYQPTVLFSGYTLYAILLVGVYSYVAMGWAAKKVGGTAVMLFMLLQAILTVIAGTLFLHEKLYLSHLVGGICIIIGLAIFVSGEMLNSREELKPLTKV